eukprot:4535548-Pleurochrysis_carterae.AAC.1
MHCLRVGQVIRKAPKCLVFSAEGVAMLATVEPQVAAASSSVPSVEQSVRTPRERVGNILESK